MFKGPTQFRCGWARHHAGGLVTCWTTQFVGQPKIKEKCRINNYHINNLRILIEFQFTHIVLLLKSYKLQEIWYFWIFNPMRGVVLKVHAPTSLKWNFLKFYNVTYHPFTNLTFVWPLRRHKHPPQTITNLTFFSLFGPLVEKQPPF